MEKQFITKAGALWGRQRGKTLDNTQLYANKKTHKAHPQTGANAYRVCSAQRREGFGYGACTFQWSMKHPPIECVGLILCYWYRVHWL